MLSLLEKHTPIFTFTHVCALPLTFPLLEGGSLLPRTGARGAAGREKPQAGCWCAYSVTLPHPSLTWWWNPGLCSHTKHVLYLVLYHRAALQPCLLLSVIKTLTHPCLASKFPFPIASLVFLFLESGFFFFFIPVMEKKKISLDFSHPFINVLNLLNVGSATSSRSGWGLGTWGPLSSGLTDFLRRVSAQP